ncbi:MAG: phosphonate C-P lyase system protein PhnH [Oscillospiraceae bacterium]
MSAFIKKHSFDMVFDSQKLFRALLKAFSNPMQRQDIHEASDKLYDAYQPLLAVAMTLLDNEVQFFVSGDDALVEEMVSLTLARRSAAEAADFIFVTDPKQLEPIIASAKCGSLSDPHKSATILIPLDGEASERLTLTGPGINGTLRTVCEPCVREALRLRDAQCYEYPQGIDFIFIDGAGGLFAIPRLVKGSEA